MTWWQKCLSCSVAFFLTGCQSLHYYGHSVKGQWQIISQRQAISTVMAHPKTPPQLVHQLHIIQNIRLFAVGLGLPRKGNMTLTWIFIGLMLCGRWQQRLSCHYPQKHGVIGLWIV